MRSKLPFLDWDEICDDRKFTRLHRTVCGIDNRRLDEVIRTELANVNMPDFRGLRPLHYATLHKSVDQIRILLENGARPILDDQLLQNWSNICHTNTAVYLDVDRLLLQYIDVNTQIKNGMTLLMMMCQTFTLPALRIMVLLDHGAKINLVDDFGRAAIMHCFDSDSPCCLPILYRHGARLDIKTIRGDTILHYAILQVKNPSIIKELRRMDLSMIDLKTKDQDGATAFDLLKMRNGLKWKSYYMAHGYPRNHQMVYLDIEDRALNDNDERQIIYGFEALIYEIQDSQAVPKEEQYPPLGGFLSSVVDEELVPGAWPV